MSLLYSIIIAATFCVSATAGSQKTAERIHHFTHSLHAPGAHPLDVPELALGPTTRPRRNALGFYDIEPVNHAFDSENLAGAMTTTYEGAVHNHTVRLGDYEDALVNANFECVPMDENGKGFNVMVRPFTLGGEVYRPYLNFTLVPDLFAWSTEAGRDLNYRLSVPRALIIFSLSTLATHPAFDVGTSCGDQVPYSRTYYRVLLRTDDSQGHIRLCLRYLSCF